MPTATSNTRIRTFNETKAYLQKTNDKGQSIYGLLVDMVLQSNAGDDEPVDFEKLVSKLQKESFALSYHKPRIIPRGVSDDLIHRAQKSKDLLLGNEKRRAAPLVLETELPDVLETNRILSFAGVGLDDGEAYRVQSALTQFAREKQFKVVRFFGKIFGTSRNYYILETSYEAPNDVDSKLLQQDSIVNKYRVRMDGAEQPPEQGGEGTNKWTYWVCNNPADRWIRLPDVTPAQIVTARQLKKYFTGDLTHPIQSYPQFPGNESNLLRVQVGRISAGTLIAPKGMYKMYEKPEEEDDEDEPKEPIVPPERDYVLAKGGDEEEEEEEGKISAQQLVKLDNWVHLTPHILDVGRITEYKPPKVKKDDEDDEDDEEEEEEAANLVPRLRELNQDTGLQQPDYITKPEKKKKKQGDEEEEEEEEPEEEEEDGEDGLKKGQISAWKVKLYGELNKPYANAVIQSLRWPGAFSYGNGELSDCVYIGYGFKKSGDLNIHTPTLPPPISAEPAEPVEIQDPTTNNEQRVKSGQEPLKDPSEEAGEDGEDDE